MIAADAWALCWSQSQSALHVETMRDHLANNCAACAADRPGDFRVLHVGSRADVDAAAVRVSAALQARFPAANADMGNAA